MKTINYAPRDPQIYVKYHDRTIDMRELASLVGIDVRTLRTRYRSGDRGEKLWRPLDFQQRRFPAEKPVNARELRRRELVARALAARDAELARPLIDSRLVTKAERQSIRARIKHARGWELAEGEIQAGESA